MQMGPVGWIVAGSVAFFLILIIAFAYLSFALAWGDQRTDALAYFGLDNDGRHQFRKTLSLHARLLRPLIWLIARASRPDFDRVSFTVEGISGPNGTCSEESFRSGIAYEPDSTDVFVVTQMKCGTTWMQHVAYEVLMRGQGDLVSSETTLCAVSPWLESRKGVPVTRAPHIGLGPARRVIKTHLPEQLCPDSPEARYIYVTRHPGSCFASCVDFLAENLGPFTPPLEVIEQWFCDDARMWWGAWPDHVLGWWERAQRRPGVLWVRFEDMKGDLGDVVDRVAAFLDVPLTDAERAQVVRKCSFEYMREHQTIFEMHPPHLIAPDPNLFVTGSARRYRDVPDAVNARIVAWSDARLAGKLPSPMSYPTQLQEPLPPQAPGAAG